MSKLAGDLLRRQVAAKKVLDKLEPLTTDGKLTLGPAKAPMLESGRLRAFSLVVVARLTISTNFAADSGRGATQASSSGSKAQTLREANLDMCTWISSACPQCLTKIKSVICTSRLIVPLAGCIWESEQVNLQRVPKRS